VGKYSTAGQTTDNNIAHALFALVTKAANAHSEYAILIAFPLQQWWHERASILHYAYSACLVFFLGKWPRNDA
jgi:hypothetical protein